MILTRWIARALWPMIRPIIRLVIDGDDPWEPVNRAVPFYTFGLGSRRRFSWYFEGETTVQVESLEAVCDWLRGCEYVRDHDLFHEADYWQHPKTFEILRRGDCEDHALWAWRKLNELGIATRFYVGHVGRHDRLPERHHAWLLVDHEGTKTILEATAKADVPMLQPFAQAKAEYVPYFSVGASYRGRSYVGYLHWLVLSDNGRIKPGAG